MRHTPGAILALPLLAILVLTAGCGGADTAASETPTSAATPTPRATATSLPIDLAEPTAAAPVAQDDDVFATGFVEAARDADLVFQVNGQVEQVLVEEGEFAREDEVLAVLDTRTFDQNVLNAEAALARAQADRLALLEDPQPERVRAAQASITQAQGQLNQVQGSVTQEDINAAQANVDEARAALADLEAGADTLDIQAAQTRVDQARASMQTTRDQLSQAKTQAEISMHQAAERVRSAQVDYSAAYWDWQYVKENGTDPPVNEVSPKIPLSDHSEQGYRDRFNQAEIMLRQAEDDLRAATERYEDTLQNEVTGIQEAEARLQDAQIALDQVLEPAEADQLAAARARLSNAQAQLAKLQGQQREGQLTAAQAGVANAQAQLEQLYSDPTESQLMRADANIASAEAQLEQARLNREYAELEAPFSGEIATVNIDPGDPATTVGGQPAIRMIDLSELRVEVEVPDVDIARVRVGQTAEVVADALPNEVFMGEVSFVAPAATTDQQGIIKYEVRIDLNDDAELPLRVGMSVSVTINTNTITNNSNRRDNNDTDSTDALTDTDSTDALTDTFTTNSSDDTDDTDE